MYNNHKKPFVSPENIFFISDVFAILLAFASAALLLWFFATPEISTFTYFEKLNNDPWRVKIFLAGALLFILSYGGHYNRANWESEEFKYIIQAVFLILSIDGLILYLFRIDGSRVWLLSAWPLVALYSITARMIIRALPAVSKKLTRKIIMIGQGTDKDELEYHLRESRSANYRVYHPVHVNIAELARSENDAFDQSLLKIATDFQTELGDFHFIISPSDEERSYARILTKRLSDRNLNFMVVLPYAGLPLSKVNLHKMIGSDFLVAEVLPKPSHTFSKAFKRVMDFMITLVAVILGAPLILGIMFGLYVQGRPVFFRQPRVGKDAKIFNCLKFRTMVPDAEDVLETYLSENDDARALWKSKQKLEFDPRITRLGKFLRKTSLDELPQLFNILKGDMSIVGPRPIIAPHIKGYEPDYNYYHSDEFSYYKSVRPGITGLWQVSGRSSTTHMERKRLDRWYVRNWSIWLDFVVLLKTVRVAILGSDAF